MRVIYRKIRHARYLYVKRDVEKVWGARYTLGARYLSKNTVHTLVIPMGSHGLHLVCYVCLKFISYWLIGLSIYYFNQ